MRMSFFGIFTSLVAAKYYFSVFLLWLRFIILSYVKQSFALIFSMDCQQYLKLWFWPPAPWSSHLKPSPSIRWSKAVVTESQRILLSFHFICSTQSWGWDWSDLICGMEVGWLTPVWLLLRVHPQQGFWPDLSSLAPGLFPVPLSHVACWKWASRTPRTQTFMPIIAYSRKWHHFYIKPITFFSSLSATQLWVFKKVFEKQFYPSFWSLLSWILTNIQMNIWVTSIPFVMRSGSRRLEPRPLCSPLVSQGPTQD